MVNKPKKVVIFFYWRLFSKQNSAAKIKSFNELRKRFVLVAENFMRNFLLLLNALCLSLESIFSSIGTLFENKNSVPCRF